MGRIFVEHQHMRTTKLCPASSSDGSVDKEDERKQVEEVAFNMRFVLSIFYIISKQYPGQRW